MSAYEQAGKSDDWYTPKYIFDAMECKFSLDVSSPKEGPRYVPTCDWMFEGSLQKDWYGFVWMNPPFGHQSTKQTWLRKFFIHRNGVALLPDRTSAPWWQYAASQADAILFLAGKVKFERPDGSIGEQPGTGTCLFASGRDGITALYKAKKNKLGTLMVRL